MAELIVGHTTHESTRLWIRGGRRHTAARVVLKRRPDRNRTDPEPAPRSRDRIESEPVRLERANDYVAVVPVELDPGTEYSVVAEFARTRWGLAHPTEVRCGRVRAAPDPAREDPPFDFLLGSCNLPAARITRVGAMAASGLGTVVLGRSAREPRSRWIWPRPETLRWRLVWAALRAVPCAVQRVMTRAPVLLWGVTMQLTRFRQPALLLESPFRPLLDATQRRRPAFMIHAGDQMYFDVDVPVRTPDVEEYRRAYREAWFEDDAARSFLAGCTQYMILDDHEIADGFANQPRLLANRAPALEAYREYVRGRQPDGDGPDAPGYYAFRHGSVRFFVLDVRTERSIEARRMIDPAQMEALRAWLTEHRDAVKFVVSSVPFVAQLRPRDEDGGASIDPEDKWCGSAFRGQRDEIIDFVYGEGIGRLTFLVGDMHCTYHATLRVGPPDRRLAIHELAAGPINQVQFTPRSAFHDQYRGRTEAGRHPFSSVVQSFQGACAAVLRIHVDPAADRVTWTCVPTRPPRGDRYEPPPMSGRIRLSEAAA